MSQTTAPELHVPTDPSTPPWMREVVDANVPSIHRLLEAPVLVAARKGTLDEARMRRFLVQTHQIVSPFEFCMAESARQAGEAGEQEAHGFWARNAQQERRHATWWGWIGQYAYGMSHGEYEGAHADPAMAALRDRMLDVARTGSLVTKIGFLNCGIEWPTSEATAYAGPTLVAELRRRAEARGGRDWGRLAPRWVVAHMSGDLIHTLGARKVAERLCGSDQSRQEFAQQVACGIGMFTAAMVEAY